MEKGFAIAIDGPVASGKGTIARLLAKTIPNGYYFYTGAMYRCVALQTINEKENLEDEQKVLKSSKKASIDFENEKILLNNKEVTERIKKEDAAKGASIVATYQRVREYLVREQQKIAKREIKKGKVVIAEGRDIGTRVLPNAAIKIFLNADPLERAKRRKAQEKLKEDLKTVLEMVKERDKKDMERKIDPLVKDPKRHGYFVLDSTNLSIKKTLSIIMSELKKRRLL